MMIRESTNKTKSLSHCSEINHSPENTNEKSRYKFNCPICFNFFSNIFISKCWRNYFWNNCYQKLKDDIKSKRHYGAVRCIFWGRFPLKLENVDWKEQTRVYNDAPLKALHSKLSISDLDEKSGIISKFPNSFSNLGKKF